MSVCLSVSECVCLNVCLSVCAVLNLSVVSDSLGAGGLTGPKESAPRLLHCCTVGTNTSL